MSCNNFIKNITSKDNQLSLKTTETLIKSENLDLFRELCEKADFIFPFLKEKIIKNFVKLVNKEDLKNVFNFTKIYCEDFEDLIVNSWTKFANEDLTDEILELFETGTDEQKTYCAKYFSKIQDPLALELLILNSKSSFSPLKINCAKTLSVFSERTVLEEMKNVISNSNDEFEKVEAFEFINAYGGEEQIKFIIQNCFNSPFSSTIIANLLDFNNLETLKIILKEEEIIRIFELIIEEYPEDISLNTIQYYQIYDFIELIYNYKNAYGNNVLLLAKNKFNEFSENDIYSFDLDNNLKNELKEITKLLNSLNLAFSVQELEYNSNCAFRFSLALDVVQSMNLQEHSNKILNLINDKKLSEDLIAQSAQVLKAFNKLEEIDLSIIDDLKNENVKALIKSLF